MPSIPLENCANAWSAPHVDTKRQTVKILCMLLVMAILVSCSKRLLGPLRYQPLNLHFAECSSFVGPGCEWDSVWRANPLSDAPTHVGKLSLTRLWDK